MSMRSRWRREDGQALIFVVLTLPVILALAALVIDGGNVLVQKRLVQNAADSAALAAAQDLSAGAACADSCRVKIEQTAGHYSDENKGKSSLHRCTDADPSNPTDTNCYAAPYVNKSGVTHDDLVEVRLRNSVSTFFGGVFGISSMSVAARAVASAKALTSTTTTTIPGTTNPGSTTPASTVAGTSTSTSTITTTTPGTALAIFAYTHNGADPCSGPGITVTGNPQTSIGAVVSNGSVNAGRSPADDFKGTLGYAGYGPPAKNCPLTKIGSGSIKASERLTAPRPWPRTFDRAAICAGHDSAALRTLSNPADGVYCSTVRINVTNLRSVNHVTLVAPVVDIAASLNNVRLNPAPALSNPLDPNHDLVVWQYGANQNFSFDHNNSGISGVIWVENGDLSYVGNSGSTGYYQAQNISIVGNSYVMQGNGPPVGGTTSTTTVATTTTTSTVTPPVTIAGTTVSGSSSTATNVTGTTIGLNE